LCRGHFAESTLKKRHLGDYAGVVRSDESLHSSGQLLEPHTAASSLRRRRQRTSIPFRAGTSSFLIDT
jgi:hypothetical protein